MAGQLQETDFETFWFRSTLICKLSKHTSSISVHTEPFKSSELCRPSRFCGLTVRCKSQTVPDFGKWNGEGKEQSWNGKAGDRAWQDRTSSSCCSLRRIASASHWHNPPGSSSQAPPLQQQLAWSSHAMAGARALVFAAPVQTVNALSASECSKCFISLFLL